MNDFGDITGFWTLTVLEDTKTLFASWWLRMRFGLIPRERRGTSGLLAFEFLEFILKTRIVVFETGVFCFERRVFEFEFLDALNQVSDETDQFSLTELIEVRAGWHVRILRLKADQQHRNPHTSIHSGLQICVQAWPNHTAKLPNLEGLRFTVRFLGWPVTPTTTSCILCPKAARPRNFGSVEPSKLPPNWAPLESAVRSVA